MKIGNRNYFLWLLHKIEWYSIDVYEHEDLLKYLFDTEFTWTIDHDANRAAKGLNLRYEYNKKWDYGDTPCSVLEMLIALARDWEHEICYDFEKGDRSALWFWTMIKNLKLMDSNEYSKILKKWLSREFDEDGYGSPFPRKNCDKDQRKVEIWMQLQGYVLENVEI